MAGHLGPRDLESGHVVPSGGHVEFRNIGGNFNFLECSSVVANVKYRNSFQTKWNRPHSTWADLFKYFVTFTSRFFRMVWSKKSIHYYHVNFRPYDLQKNSCWTFLCWIRHKNGKYEMFNFIMETLKLAQCQTEHPFVNTAFLEI